MRKDISAVRGVLDACRSAFTGIFIISAVINVLMLTGPIFMLQVYDRVLASNSVPTLVVLAGITLALYAFSWALDLLRSRALTRVSMRVFTKLSDPALRAHAILPIVAGQKAGALQPGRDVDAIRRFLGSQGPAAIFDLPFMPLYFVILFLFHPMLGLLSLGGGVLIFILVVANEMSSREPARELNKASGAQSKIMESTRRNAEVVTSMGMLGRIQEQFVQKVAAHCDAQQTTADRSNFYSTIIKTLRLILQSAMLGLGAYLAIFHEITPGVMIASSIIMARALAPIEQAVGQWPSFVAARQASGRLAETLRQVPEESGSAGLPLPREDLKVEQLATTAPGEPVVLLQGANFALRAGDGLGVIGHSGSGKTSLARALVGVWPTVSGSVRLDGSTIDQWTDEDRGKLIGYLPQDVELFDGSVADNISRFAANPKLIDIVAAAKLAGIHKMIAGLPEGYGSMVGEGGMRLSAGQRQRIGLARAIFGNPFLLVLDEPNSNLDQEGERALTEALLEMRKRGSIVIVIAHRTSALAAVNHVLVVQNGKQADFGPRDAVLGNVSVLPVPAGKEEVRHAV